jgi:hypothetical protein
LLAASGTTGLWALDPETGREVWRQTLPHGGLLGAGADLRARSRQRLALGVFLISPLGGELIDGIHMVDGSAMTPAAAGSHAYVLTNGGRSCRSRSPIRAAASPEPDADLLAGSARRRRAGEAARPQNRFVPVSSRSHKIHYVN